MMSSHNGRKYDPEFRHVECGKRSGHPYNPLRRGCIADPANTHAPRVIERWPEITAPTESKMHWSLSEFLNLIDLRGQSWCFVNMGARSGFHLLHSEAVLFHAVLEGTAKITSGIGQTTRLKAGDIVMVLSGDAHAVRNHQGSATELIDLLNNGDYVDSPR